MPNILVIDDDVSIRNMLVDYFSQNGFYITALESSAQLTRHLAGHPTDLVLVDLNLGNEDGLGVVEKLNTRPDIPVIIMTGQRMEEMDKVVGLELGAADYVTKPFALRELLARVRAALRERPERKVPSAGCIYTFDGWRVNTRHRKLRDIDGVEKKLTSAEFNLLMAFLKSPRKVLSREQLLLASRVYDQEIYDRSIDVLILRLRRKLEKDPSSPSFIKTERGAGYHFDVDVHVEELRVRA